MQTRIYNGPFPEVEVPLETGKIIAEYGVPREFPEAVSASLDLQGDTWLNPSESSHAELSAMKRGELDEIANELGVDASALPNKSAVVSAIEAARAQPGDQDPAEATASESSATAGDGE